MSFRAASSSILSLALVFTARSAMAATCSLGDHAGIDEAEAKTAARVVCHELVSRAPNTSFEVSLGKLSGRTLVSVVEAGNEAHHVRTFVSGLDELDIAAPRLATAITESMPLAETRNVDNVISEEGRAAKKVASEVGATMGMYAQSSLGAASAPSAGVDVGLAFRTGRFGFSGDGRLGGIGSSETKLANASLDVGARVYLSNSEIAPFLGGGASLSWFKRTAANDANDQKGSGAGAFVAIGIEAFRTSHAGLMAALRADLPFYALESDGKSDNPYSYPYVTQAPLPRTSAYVVPISLTLAMTFH